MKPKKIKVLLIDDDKNARSGLATYLRHIAEFEVVECGEGQEGLDILSEPAQAFSVVLLDYALTPEMHGEQVLDEIRRSYKQLPVVVITGKEHRRGLASLRRGANRFVQRPISGVEIEDIVLSLVEQDELFWQLAHDARELLGFDFTVAWRLDRVTRRLRVAAWDEKKGGSLDKTYRQNVSLDLDGTATRYLFAKQKPLFLSDVTDPKSSPQYLDEHRDFARKQGWRSLMAIPLIHNERIIGLIDCYSYRIVQLSTDEKRRWLEEKLPAFARQAAQSVRNTQLSNDLHALLKVNELLGSTFGAETVISEVLASALRLTGANRVWLHSLSGVDSILQPRGHLNASGQITLDEVPKEPMIARQVAKSGKPVWIEDVSAQEDNTVSELIESGSVIAIPLRLSDISIGVLTVVSEKADHFTSDDLTILFSLAAPAAVAIQRRDLSHILQRLSQLALSEGYDVFAKHVVNSVHELTGEQVILWKMSEVDVEKGQFLRIGTHQSELDEQIEVQARIPISDQASITAEALRTGEPILRADIQDDAELPRFYNFDVAEQMNIRSIMVVPIVGRNRQPLGSLSLYSKEIDRFGPADKDLLSTFANQIASLVESISHTKSLENLNEVGQKLAGIQNVDDVRQQIVAQAMRILDADAIVLYQYDSATDSLIASPMHLGVREPYWLERSGKFHENSIAIAVARTGRLRRTKNAQRKNTVWKPNRPPGSPPTFIQREEVVAVASIPLKALNRVVGVLFVNYRRPHTFDAVELDKLEQFSNIAGAALENARLFEENERRIVDLETINDVVKSMSSILDFEELMNMIVKSTAETLKCKHCSFFRPLEIEGEVFLVPEASFDRKNPDRQVTRKFLVDESSIVGSAYRSGETIRLSDARQDEKRFAKSTNPDDGQLSMLVVPVRSNDQVIGALSADQEAAAWFNESDQLLMEALATNAGIALERSIGLSLLQKIAARIIVSQGVDDVLSEIVHGAISLTNTTEGIIHLLSHDGDGISIKEKKYQWPLEFQHTTPRLGTGTSITERIIDKSDIVAITDIQSDPDIGIGLKEKFKSMIGVPLVLDDKVIGVLYLNDKQEHRFSEIEKSLLRTLASQGAAAIQVAETRELEQELAETASREAEARTEAAEARTEAAEARAQAEREEAQRKEAEAKLQLAKVFTSFDDAITEMEL